ncbi:MAG: carboxynorspermidine decarboxylase [Clostridia bacterium]
MKIDFDINAVKTPYYIVDEHLLIQNLEILKDVMDRAGCEILLAQKAFSMFSLYPFIGKYLSGTAASGLFEARLGHEEMGKETHVFSPAYQADEFDEILEICDHIIFNSFSQWETYRARALARGIASGKKFGMRINPECSTQEHAIYDPCAPGSRLGVTLKNFKPELLEGISGLHFHTLCEQNADDFVRTLAAFESKFEPYLSQMEWVNFGGGHHITRADYDVELLISTILAFKAKYNLKVYLEPGEAIALNTGYLVASVVDLFENDGDIAILDASAACHMPDVLEMPYRPKIVEADLPFKKKKTYRLGGPTCLAGDIIGEYSFDRALAVGERLVFCDMAIYSMVKNNTFNGINLPSIAVVNQERKVRVVKRFGYDDFKCRLS